MEPEAGVCGARGNEHVVDRHIARAIESGPSTVSDQHHDQPPHVPSPSLWPIGFAIGIACVLVGLVVSIPALVVGLVLALVFGLLWARDLVRPVRAAREPARPAVATYGEAGETYDRSMFLSLATVGIGGAIGAAVTLPVLGFALLPSFVGDGVESQDVDLGPIGNFPEGQFVIATYLENPDQGEVSRRTAFVRNNGPTDAGVPSFTMLFSRCVHLGCPVQPNGPIDEDALKMYKNVELRPVLAASFGCPCHGGLYDSEGNREAGPPVRSLDRYEFSIRNGNVILGRLFSVGDVDGNGASARLTKYYHAYPGVHVDGIEKWLYPIPTPGTT